MDKPKVQLEDKPKEPSSPTQSLALSSQQEKKLRKKATQRSSSEEEEEEEEEEEDDDDKSFSSDEETKSLVNVYAKKVLKYVKKNNMYGYNVHLREGRHHQQVKIMKIKHKKKKKEMKPKQEALTVVREWISGGESSSCSSSDESSKNFTTRFMQGPSSSSHFCLMARGIESNENDELKQEVKWLMGKLAKLKGMDKADNVQASQDKKSNVQPSQNNRDHMVKKLEKGATVTCFKCHEEGHKSYQCPQVKKMNFTIKSSLIYTKPNHNNKAKSNTYVIKKKTSGKVIAHKVGKMKKEWGWNRPIWVPKEVITNMKGSQMVWVPKDM
nr:uncharacterized protein DDB_G0286299-like [Setaria viridis]